MRLKIIVFLICFHWALLMRKWEILIEMSKCFIISFEASTKKNLMRKAKNIHKFKNQPTMNPLRRNQINLA